MEQKGFKKRIFIQPVSFPDPPLQEVASDRFPYLFTGHAHQQPGRRVRFEGLCGMDDLEGIDVKASALSEQSVNGFFAPQPLCFFEGVHYFREIISGPDKLLLFIVLYDVLLDGNGH